MVLGWDGNQSNFTLFLDINKNPTFQKIETCYQLSNLFLPKLREEDKSYEGVELTKYDKKAKIINVILPR